VTKKNHKKKTKRNRKSLSLPPLKKLHLPCGSCVLRAVCNKSAIASQENDCILSLLILLHPKGMISAVVEQTRRFFASAIPFLLINY
jgi:hypothetical protein